ncbi:MAG: CpsD/CapB family tyrosine-protein kinase [Sphingomonadaceae bacterium]
MNVSVVAQSLGAAHGEPHVAVRFPSLEDLAEFVPTTETIEAEGLVGFGRKPLAARPFNLLRAQVLKRAAKLGGHLFGVTSAAPDAGKSFVTTNVAAALARIPGQRVVLIDLDLRRPSIADRFGLDLEQGIDAWLLGKTDDLRQCGVQVKGTGLSIFPANRVGDGSGELLASAHFEALANAMRQLPESTIVLCDLPPAFVSDDAMTAVSKLDGYIHVIDEGVTPKRQAEELRLLMDPAPCLGAVLNRYSGRWNDSYGYSAGRKYARYYDQED